MERREMFGGGVVAGLAGLLGSAPEAAAQSQGDGREMAAAIDRLRVSFERQFEGCELGPCASITAIRQQQRTFIRANQKYPDFMEVGLGVWEDVYDWHVKHRQTIAASRLTDGRYVLAFMFTNLLLRSDQSPEYVGFGFDGERPRP